VVVAAVVLGMDVAAAREDEPETTSSDSRTGPSTGGSTTGTPPALRIASTYSHGTEKESRWPPRA
jgi:hypothetical protein